MVRAVQRALNIFDVFDRAHATLSLQQISERVGVAKATAFRLVATLEQSGFLVRLDNGRYCLSRKLVRLAGLVPSHLNVRELARPIMRELNAASGETITLNERAGDIRVCIDTVDTPSALMTIVSPGEHVPLTFGATGRILLAYMEPAEREPIIAADAELDRAAVERELKRFRRQGFALTRGQRVAGITAIAAPVFDNEGRARHCLALTGPSVRVDNRDAEFAELLQAAAEQLTARLGGVRPD